MFRNTDFAWFIEQGVELFVPLLAVLITVILAVKAYKDALKTQAHDYQNQFQLKLFEQLKNMQNQTVTALVEYNSHINGFHQNLKINYDEQLAGRMPIDWGKRPELFSNLYYSVIENILKLMGEIESVQIVDPRLKVFITALHSAIYDLNRAQKERENAFFRYSVKNIKMPNGESRLAPPDPINSSTLEEIDRLIQETSKIVSAILDILHDLTIESQNLLLGKIFNNKTASRPHIAARMIVISLDNHQAIEKHFRDNTEWGKVQATAIEAAKTKPHLA